MITVDELTEGTREPGVSSDAGGKVAECEKRAESDQGCEYSMSQLWPAALQPTERKGKRSTNHRVYKGSSIPPTHSSQTSRRGKMIPEQGVAKRPLNQKYGVYYPQPTWVGGPNVQKTEVQGEPK